MSLECIDTNGRCCEVGASWRAWLRTSTLERIWNAPRLWLERARMRRELATLDSLIMRDAGLSAIEVCQEADKPFWRE